MSKEEDKIKHSKRLHRDDAEPKSPPQNEEGFI